MSKKNFKQECSEVIYDLMHSCYDELNLFCEIMGYPKSEVNRFIGEDPHGIADIMEGYRYFNMTDIHVVISEYEHWMEIYKTNEELRKAVDAWYYYCQEWHEQHSSEGCPNLRSWLAGCPVDGLRDATFEWQTQRESDLQAARQRVEEAKQALEDAIKEEVKLNKF